MALWCVAAIVTLPLFGMAVLSGQTTDEAGLDATRSAEVKQAANQHYNPSENATESSKGRNPGEDCIRCRTHMTLGFVYWHRTEGVAPPRTGHRVGHGEHADWKRGPCFMIHRYCAFPIGAHELAQEISDAVAAQDVAALADYTKLPSVDLFAERLAIQVRGCDGRTIAGHIPLSPELLAAIEAAAVPLPSGG